MEQSSTESVKQKKTVMMATISPAAVSLYIDLMTDTKRCAMWVDARAIKAIVRPDIVGIKRT